ncbi:hypothetical protein RRG08_062574 [Elysia crispata]|uniref:Aquaporin n=1 Tax=Elysia crispata TaxID=231223 RepID=A0AAE1ANG1_9GAST|nr:hypothetical protein RRG08_062574 [Elysia crispata]
MSSRLNLANTIAKEVMAEFLGTAVLMVFGIGSVAQFVLSEGQTGSTDQVRWSWGLGVTFGVYVAGGISGGHLNPAVTLTLCLFKRVSWVKLLPYWLGQYLGSFVASCLVYLVYYDAFGEFKGGNHTLETASIFSTYPQDYLSVGNGLGDQIFGTAVLMLLVMAISDQNNMAPSKGYVPLLVGLVVVAIGMTFSHNCGYAINPARDLSPRIFTMLAGWGTKVFSVNNYRWFWIPVLGPYIGAVVGGGVYEFCIGLRLPCCGKDDLGEDQNDVAPSPINSEKASGEKGGEHRNQASITTLSNEQISSKEFTRF